MMSLPISLRKIFVAIFVFGLCFIMFLYRNETTESLKPTTLFLTNFEKAGRANPPEKTWTYHCVNNRCIRSHYLYEERNDKRIPFMTCKMQCGPLNVWPQPTKKAILGSSSLNFNSKDIKVKLSTLHRDVEKLIRQSVSIFENDVKHLEEDNMEEDINSEDLDDGKYQRRRSRHEQKGNEDHNSFAPHRNEVNEKYDVDSVLLDIKITTFPEIYLTLETDESYNLSLEHVQQTIQIKIIAKSFFGARHALATLYQLIWYDDEEQRLKIVNKAEIIDAPKFRYRGLMLDTSRHYFSVQSIKRTLVGMAYSKLNRFHWHLTDSQSFPFVSKYYPELAAYGAYSSKEVYTIDDIKEIAEFARVRGIQVIPEIDAPAHSGNGWDWGPKHGLGELSLCINQQPWNYYCGEPPCGQLNPKNNNTFLILQKLYQELLEAVGPLDFYHLGGDEVNLDCWAQHFNDTDLRMLWCDFMLQTYQRLKIANNGVPIKTAAVWSSGLTGFPCLSKNTFAVQVWGGSQWQENYQLIDHGHNLIISHVDAWYLDCGFGQWRSTGEAACSPYRTWQTVYKHRPWSTMRLNTQQMKQILGGEVCLWTEQVDESILDSRLWPRSSALAERLWTDPYIDNDQEALQKDVFSRMSVFRNRLVQLGVRAEPIFPKYCAQNQDECV